MTGLVLAPGGYEVHPSAVVDHGASIGKGTRIWHFCHVDRGARIGAECSLGQNTFVASGAQVGDRVRVQNNVSIYEGVSLEDDVFCGPSVVFTNVIAPRSEYPVDEYSHTRVGRGATLGANSTVRCGLQLGAYCFVGAGALVLHDIPDYGLVVGVPGKRVGWVSRRAARLKFDANGVATCPEGGDVYRYERGQVRQIDEQPSPSPG